MRLFKFLLTGILFGIIMTKSEVVSWFKIQEMFRFQSFHMYGVIGIAVILGALMNQVVMKMDWKNAYGTKFTVNPKAKTYKASIFGGFIFGIGWAMTGACPGPLYVLTGHGYFIVLVIIISALLGTLFYGAVKKNLPH